MAQILQRIRHKLKVEQIRPLMEQKPRLEFGRERTAQLQSCDTSCAVGTQLLASESNQLLQKLYSMHGTSHREPIFHLTTNSYT